MITIWPTKKLAEVCERIKSKKAPISTNPYIEIGDIDIETKEIKLKEKGAVKGSIFAPENCIIVSRVRPTRGAVALIKKKTAVSSAFTILKPKSFLDLKFLFYYLAYNHSFFNHLELRQKGSNYPSVREEDILNFKIPLPPLNIQKQIVARIEELFEKIDKAKELREKAKEETTIILSSAMHENFSKIEKKYKTKMIKDVVTRIQYGLSKKMNEIGVGYKILRMDNISKFRIEEKNIKYVEISKDEFFKYKLEKGDVLFNRVNSFELVGKTGIFDLDGDYIFASYLIRLRPNPDFLNSYFLNYFLNSPQTQNKLKFIARRAVQQANINSKEIASLQIPLPPLPEQKKIVSYFDDLREKVDKLKKIQEEQLKDLVELKKSILEQAFSGKLI